MPRLTRREFVAGAAAAMGATLAWGAPRPTRSRTRWVERRDLFAQGVASGDPGVRQRPPVDARLVRGRRGRRHADGRGGRGPGVRARGRQRADARARGGRPHLPRARRRAAARRGRTGIASRPRTGEGSRIGRTRTAPAPDDPRPGALRVRELPERVRGRAERVPPDDLRGRARRAGGAARVRPAPGRLHLRGRRVPGGPARGPALRPPPARIRSASRTARRCSSFHVPVDGGRLPRALSRLPPGPGPAGRARPLAVRGHVGQPRVLVAWAGSRCRCFGDSRPARRRRARSRPTRPGSSTSRRASARRAANRSSGSRRRP